MNFLGSLWLINGKIYSHNDYRLPFQDSWLYAYVTKVLNLPTWQAPLYDFNGFTYDE